MSRGRLSDPYTPQASGRPGQMTTAARNYKTMGKVQLKENKTRDVIELDREKEEKERYTERGFTMRLAYLRRNETTLIRPRIIVMEAPVTVNIQERENSSKRKKFTIARLAIKSSHFSQNLRVGIY